MACYGSLKNILKLKLSKVKIYDVKLLKVGEKTNKTSLQSFIWRYFKEMPNLRTAQKTGPFYPLGVCINMSLFCLSCILCILSFAFKKKSHVFT